ncbi:MAG: FtsX-like permease family protein [Myxococcales bacterium]|nr:FtsX-like permease family protein [Myxococcales bacterium]
MLTQGADGSMANELYTVRGVLKSVGEATDRGAVFMTQGAFRDLMVVPEGVHQLIVRRPAALTLAQAGAEVRGLTPGLDAKTWQELAPVLADLHETQRSVITIFFLIVYLAIGIVILNAMLMAVFERIRELGVMKALGMGGEAVLGLILAESGVMTALSVVVALGLSVPALYYFVHTGIDVSGLSDVSVQGIAMDPIWRASVSRETMTQAVGLFVFIAVGAALYPAAKAARLAPVAAMHHQ